MRHFFILLMAFVFFAPIVVPASAPIAAGADYSNRMNEFYNGLANIIEENTDKPRECLLRVDEYYVSHGELIQRVRGSVKESMRKTTELLKEQESFGSMSEEDIADFHNKINEISDEARELNISVSEGTKRYTLALSEFAKKHPNTAIKITMKTMVFLPDDLPEEYE